MRRGILASGTNTVTTGVRSLSPSHIMEIPLSNGGVAIIDDADYPLVKGHRWRKSHKNKTQSCYAVCSIKVGGKFINLRMHSLLLKVPPGLQIDHANRNGLDNRRCNLRIATHSQNQANRGPLRHNTSGFHGVSRTRSGKWEACISQHNSNIHLGYFHCKTLAAHAYDVAAMQFFGPFATLNFPAARRAHCTTLSRRMGPALIAPLPGAPRRDGLARSRSLSLLFAACAAPGKRTARERVQAGRRGSERVLRYCHLRRARWRRQAAYTA